MQHEWGFLDNRVRFYLQRPSSDSTLVPGRGSEPEVLFFLQNFHRLPKPLPQVVLTGAPVLPFLDGEAELALTDEAPVRVLAPSAQTQVPIQGTLVNV